ncbi:DNA repair protein RecN [bacterium]|nr:DNA repair protein RecN [bacterium]
MLTFLRIENLALIERVEIEFGPGLNAMTGETGAGKSVVLESIGLLLGDRAQPALVRDGCDRGSVEALVDLRRSRPVSDWLAEHCLVDEEMGELLIRREILASGRSRAFVNGRLVTVAQLAELGALLVDIHGQNDHQSLMDPKRQCDLLDDHGECTDLRVDFEAAWDELATARLELQKLEADDLSWRQRLDFLQFQIAEIEELGIGEGEVGGLEAERGRLAFVDALTEDAAGALGLLVEGDERPALDGAGQALRLVERMLSRDPGLGDLHALLEGAVAQLSDATSQLESYASRLEGDPERLAFVEERLDAIQRLTRKHGVDAEGLLGLLENLLQEADSLTDRDSRRDELAATVARLEMALKAKANTLTKARKAAAAKFARAVEKTLRPLAMADARFEVGLVERRELCRHGAEDVEFRLSANKGEKPASLRRVASGGELSRTMLALRTVAARAESVPILLFDEIDAGISGQATVKVADALEKLGGRHQVLCITHQAGIASRASQHLEVTKSTRRGRTIIHVRNLSPDERRRELARLLDGGKSGKSLELAEELLLRSA